jgi:hypothetical protein
MTGGLSDKNGDVDSTLRLIEDARLLGEYLASAGLLKTTALDDAINAVVAARTSRERAPAIARLRNEFSRSVNLAKPYISLVDLRSGRSPYAYTGQAQLRQVLQPIFVSCFALIAILGTVFGFAVVQDIGRDVEELQHILVQEPMQKLSDLTRLVSEGALKDPKSEYYLQYQRAQSELALLFESANEITTRTMSTLPNGPVPVGLVRKVLHVLQAEVLGSHVAPPTDVAGGPASELSNPATKPPMIDSWVPAGFVAGTGPVTSSSSTVSSNMTRGKVVPKDPLSSCKPYDDSSVRALYGTKNAAFLAAAMDRFENYCLAQTLDINTGPYSTTGISNTIRALQDELFVIGVLLLPMVGGLLGASIYVVQFHLNNRLAPTFTTVGIIFRILAGGAFGVIIGWFASSVADNSSGGPMPHITGTPYTLAFIAGFSIDTLSRLLTKYTKI